MGNSIKPHIENAQKTGVLQLSSKGIGEFPADLMKLVKVLRTLDLSQNKIAILPKSIGDFQMLKQLVLNKNRLRELPAEIGNLKKLETLNVNENQLSRLPSSIAGLKHLHTLSANNNNLTVIPVELADLPHIEAVDFSRNKICTVPDGIGGLQTIELNLNQNQVSSISEDVVQCPRLKILRLEENCLPLAALPPRLLSDSSISLLTLEGNLFELKEIHEIEGYEQYMERYTATKKKMY